MNTTGLVQIGACVRLSRHTHIRDSLACVAWLDSKRLARVWLWQGVASLGIEVRAHFKKKG